MSHTHIIILISIIRYKIKKLNAVNIMWSDNGRLQLNNNNIKRINYLIINNETLLLTTSSKIISIDMAILFIQCRYNYLYC